MTRGRAGWIAARVRTHRNGTRSRFRAIGIILTLGLLMGLFPVLGSVPAGASTPAALVFTSQPGDGDPGTLLQSQPQVTIEDSQSGTVSTSSKITLTLTDSAGHALIGVPTLTCDQTSNGVTAMNAENGIATFSGCKVGIGGSYTITATDTVDNLTHVSSPFFVSGPAQLSFNSQPGGTTQEPTTTSGLALAAQPQVTVVDGNGAAISDPTAAVTLGIEPGTGTPGATLTCDTNPVTVDSTSSIASFTGCRIDKAGTGYALVATDAAESLISPPSSPFDIGAGSPVSIAFTKQPSLETGGSPFSIQPQVVVQDANGNVVDGNTDSITIAITTGTGANNAALTCSSPGTTVQAVAGIANFSGCSIDKSSAVGYTLTATDTDSALIPPVVSGQLTVGVGTATKIAFHVEPGGGVGGSAFPTQPIVTLADAGGNPVSGSATLTLTGGTSGATLTCDSNTVPAVGGEADFSGCRIDQTGSDYQLVATSGKLSTTTDPFDIGASGATKAQFTVEPGAGKGGTALSPQPAVTLTDSSNAPASGSVTLSITPGTGTPGATLTCAANPVSATAAIDGTNETAQFTNCSIDKAGTGYSLTATSDTGATTTSTSFSVGLGSPAQLAFTAQPGGGTGGTAWLAQPVVAVEDAGGNQLPDDTSSIALSITSGTGPPSATLTCAANSLPAVRGAALFSGCAIDKTATAYTLTAEDTTDALKQTSDPFGVGIGPAAQLLFSNQPGGGTVGAPWGAQPVVAVADAGGNTVTTSNAGIALAIAPSTGAGGATLSCGTNPVTASSGAASFSSCSIDKAASGYTLVATDAVDGLQAESLPFPELLAPPTPLGVAPTGIPVAQTFGTTTYAKNPTDVTDDVNSATGALNFVSSDLQVAGVGEPFVLQRFYNSADTSGGSFGLGWTSIFDSSVSIVSQQSATVRGEDGQQIVFVWNPGSKSWVPPPGAKANLSCTTKQCTVTRFDGVSLVFTMSSNGHGQLAKYLAADGQGPSFAWTSSSVTVTIDTTNSTPYTVTATLDHGRVTGVTTPAHRSVSYRYDSNHLLTSMTDVLGNQWSYTYNTAGLLTKQTDPNGHDRLTAAYDGSGRVTSVSSMGSPHHTDDTFSYSGQTTNFVATRNALVDASGTLRRISYVDVYKNNVLVSQTTPWGGVTRYSYDPQINLIESQDPMGWVQRLSYDANNNLLQQISPITSMSSATVTMTYDNQHRLLTQTDADGNTTSYTYNGPFVGTIRPPGGNPAGTRLTYNPAGELVSQVGPTGQQQYTYDAFGNQTGMVLQDQSGKSLNGPGSKTSYDEAGDVTSRTDANGNTTTYTYDATGNLLTTTAPGPQTTTTAYTKGGDIASVTDAAGNRTEYSWDEATLTRSAVTTPAGSNAPGSPSTQTYDPSGDLLVEGNSANRNTTHVFDATGREVAKTDASNLTVRYTYDIASNIVAMTDSAGDVITQQFDSLNREVRQVVNGAVTLTGYDPAGNVVSSTDSVGTVTTSTYTSHGKVASVSNAAGQTKYAYDMADDLVSTTDPNGHVTSYTYDGAGRQTSMSTNGNTTSYSYDFNGNVKTKTDPDGRVTTYQYNPQNLPTTTTYSQSGQPTLTVTQSYDALGRRTAMTDPDHTNHTYSYDLSGNLTKATAGSDTFTYDYTQPGKIVETYPDSTTVAYSVDDVQNLMSVESDQPQNTTNQDNAGHVEVSYIRNQARETTGVSYSNGIFEADNVNQNGQVLDQALQLGGNQVANDAFTYDAAGNPLSQVDTALGTTTTNQYSYDASERLTGFSTSTAPAASSGNSISASANTSTTAGNRTPDAATTIATTLPTPPTGTSASTTSAPVTPTPATTTTGAGPAVSAPTGTAPPYYSYDAAGNLVSSGLTTSNYNASNELTSQNGQNGTTNFTYDRNGDIVKASGPGGTTTYSYDAADHLVGVQTPSSTIAYTYDGDGNRTSKTIGPNVTQYVWDVKGAYPRLVIERHGDGGLIRRYIYGDGPVAMQTPTNTYYYHLDPQGSVAELSDASGTIVAAYTYDGYGNVTTNGADAPANPLLFQGQYFDSDTGLYNMRARNYDPTTGHFTQRDPLTAPVGTPALSPYAFANDRPTDLADPTGQTTSGSGTRDFAKAIGSDLQQDATAKVQGTQTVTQANVIKTSTAPARYALSRLAAYGVQYIRSTIPSLAAKVAQSAGRVVQSLGVAAQSSSAAYLGETEENAGKVSKLGVGLLVVGIALNVFITVESCENGPVATCVGEAVGSIISIGITALCTFESAGIAAVGCNIAGGLISAGLTEIISRYGPQIAQGFVTAYNATAGALTTAYTAVSGALVSAADAISDTAVSVGGAIATGFNTFTTAISSGFQTAMSTLVAAGYSAEQLAITLATDFKEGVNDAVGALVSLGYKIDDVFTAASAVFATTAEEAAQLLKNGFNYTVNEIAGVLKSVYALGDEAAALILKNVKFAVDQVASALEGVYNDLADAVAGVLNDIEYDATQIGAALQQVFSEADKDVAVALNALGYAANVVATALVGLYNDLDTEVAVALDFASYAYDQIAGALDTVFDDVGQVAAGILKTLNTCTTDGAQACVVAIANALESAYQFADQVTAQVLEQINFAVNDVATALKSAYNDFATQVATVFKAIGNSVTDVANALNTVFSEGDHDAALVLQQVGFGLDQVALALNTFFKDPAGTAAAVLRQIGDEAGVVGTALASAYTLGLQDVAQALKDGLYAVADIATALKNTFGQAATDAAQILKNIGVAATDIASVLQSIFGAAINDIANILSDVGFSSADIQAVGNFFGGAWSSLESFGEAAITCISSGFKNC